MLKKIDNKSTVATEPAEIVTLTAKEFSYAINRLAEDARAASHKARLAYEDLAKSEFTVDPSDQKVAFGQKFTTKLSKIVTEAIATETGRLACITEYVRDTRLPWLPPSAPIKLYVGKECHSDFIKLKSGKAYSVNVLSCMRSWFEACSVATDAHISSWRRRKAAREFAKGGRIKAILKSQIHDEFKKAATIDVLKKSAFGSSLLEEATSYGYDYHFVDLKPFNMVSHDREEVQAIAICYDDGNIFVDTGWPRRAAHLAVKLAHECGHVLEFGPYFNIRKHTRKLSRQRALRSYAQFLSLREGHCIAIEFIVGSELLDASCDAEGVQEALFYPLSSQTINLLRDDPASFIRIAAASATVRNGWKLREGQCRISPALIAKFARALPPSKVTWLELPGKTNLSATGCVWFMDGLKPPQKQYLSHYAP